MKEQIVIHEKDNVAVRLAPLEDVPAGHKVALCDIPAGGVVVKYGHPIGRATHPIRAGAWVHTHNLSTALRSDGAYEYHPIPCELPPREPAQFMGFVRPDGRVGVRNEVWILPTVGCVGRVAERLAQQARAYLHGSVTNVLAFPTPTAARSWAAIRRTPAGRWRRWPAIPTRAACWCWGWAARTAASRRSAVAWRMWTKAA